MGTFGSGKVTTHFKFPCTASVQIWTIPVSRTDVRSRLDPYLHPVRYSIAYFIEGI